MNISTTGSRAGVSHRWAFTPGIRFDADGTGGGATGGDGQGDGAGGGGDRTFTQADLDRIVQQRVVREREKFADYDDVKARAAEFDKLQEAQKTETQKAIERAEAAELAVTQATQQLRTTALRAGVIAEAARRDVVDPDAAVALLPMDAVQWNETNGTWENISSALDALLEAKPYLVKPSGGTRPSGSADQGARGAAGSQLTREALKSLSPEEIVKAQDDGRLDHLLKP